MQPFGQPTGRSYNSPDWWRTGMNFLGLGPGELLLIAFLGLLVFGPSKLPEIAGQVGRAVRDFRRSTADITAEFQRSFALDELVPPEPAVGPAQVYASAGSVTEPASPPTVIAPPALDAPLAVAPGSSTLTSQLPQPTAYPAPATSTGAPDRTGADQRIAPPIEPSFRSDSAKFWDWDHPHQSFSSEISMEEFWVWPAPLSSADAPTVSPHPPGPLAAPGQPTHALPADLL
jgi:sec-independent protein translocase protein TatA